MLSSWFWRRGFETARVETVHAFSDKLARVPHRIIDRIRQTILLSDYDMTVHAVEEMAEDDLDIFDIEEAILTDRSSNGTNRIPAERNTRLRVWP